MFLSERNECQYGEQCGHEVCLLESCPEYKPVDKATRLKRLGPMNKELIIECIEVLVKSNMSTIHLEQIVNTLDLDITKTVKSLRALQEQQQEVLIKLREAL